MKTLSEIGAKRARHPEDGGLIPYRDDLDGHAIWILTKDERRELVREAIKLFIIDHLDSYLCSNGTVGSETEDLLREQGL